MKPRRLIVGEAFLENGNPAYDNHRYATKETCEEHGLKHVGSPEHYFQSHRHTEHKRLLWFMGVVDHPGELREINRTKPIRSRATYPVSESA